jgi:endonuclease/exonuclease/phosphatase family metal-dependent hydrolase
MKNLRLMSWNLLEGCHVPRSQNPGDPQLDQARLAAVRATLAQYTPQVLLVNEALWCQPVGGYHVDYAALLGYEHACAGLYDGVWGNAILSRFPVLSCRTFDIYNRGGLLAVLDVEGIHMQVATYHPHPSRYPNHKAQDYLALVGQADPSLPLILGGDFNAISPDDQPDRVALAKGFSRFSKNPEVDSARFIDAGQVVFPALTKHGMRDALPSYARRATMPTRLISSDQESAMRLDHIWVNNHIVVHDGNVLCQEETDAASDHYPVLVDIALD